MCLLGISGASTKSNFRVVFSCGLDRPNSLTHDILQANFTSTESITEIEMPSVIRCMIYANTNHISLMVVVVFALLVSSPNKFHNNQVTPIWVDFMFSVRFRRLRRHRNEFCFSRQRYLCFTLDIWNKEMPQTTSSSHSFQQWRKYFSENGNWSW